MNTEDRPTHPLASNQPATLRPLDPAAARFHETAIRCAKGIIKAWEDWYKARRP